MKSRITVLLFALITVFFGWPLLRAGDAVPRVDKIRTGVDNAMKFDVTSIPAAPGETMTVVLTNFGTLPKEAMGHNWILLVKGTDPVAFAASATSEGATGYIPA